jgi:hypothetical protein
VLLAAAIWGERTFLSARPDGKMPVFVERHGASKRKLRADTVEIALNITPEDLLNTPGFQGQYWVFSSTSNGWYLIPGHSMEHAVEQVALGLYRFTYVWFMACKKHMKDSNTGEQIAVVD